MMREAIDHRRDTQIATLEDKTVNHAVRQLDNMAVKHRIAKVVIDPTADMTGDDTNTALSLIAGERWQCTNLTRSGFCRLCTTVKEVH